MDDLIKRQDVIDALDKHIDTFDAIDTNYLCGLRTAMSFLKELPSAQPEHPLLKIIQDFKEATGCEDIIVVQKDAMKAWDENGVAYTMQPAQRTGEWIEEEEYGDLWVCDQCGFASEHNDNYCPNCGAEMRGDNNV